jgi:hypothetical protein
MEPHACAKRPPCLAKVALSFAEVCNRHIRRTYLGDEGHNATAIGMVAVEDLAGHWDLEVVV